MMNRTQLQAATDVLAQILTFRQPADAVLSSIFRRQRGWGRQDRHEIAETVFAALRHLEKIATALPKPQREPRRTALAALVLGRGLSVSAVSELCDEAERTWLEQLKAEKNRWQNELNTASELPLWLTGCLKDSGWRDEDIIRFGRSAMQSAPLDVRVNTLKARRDKVLTQLQSEGLQCAATPYSPWGIRFTDKPALNKHPLFLDGTLEVQDEGSQLLALLTGVKRGQMAVDFCAGAGGKTLAMGAMMAGSGRLYAFDIAEKRLANLKLRMVRAGLTNVHPQRIENEHDARVRRLRGKADCVLVDAPCSGLGTLRRNPDLKYRRNRDQIQALCVQQQSILQAASELVRPGGRLVYATCSVLPEENAAQVAAFTSANPQWRVQSAAEILAAAGIGLDTGEFLQLQTDVHHTDGFFAAVLTAD